MAGSASPADATLAALLKDLQTQLAGVQAKAEQIHSIKQLEDATKALMATPALSCVASMNSMLGALAAKIGEIKDHASATGAPP